MARAIDRPRRRGILSLPGLVLPLAVSVLLAWPMLVLNAPLLFPDTITYVNQGHEVVRAAMDVVLGGWSSTVPDTYLHSRSLRSAPYAVFVYLTSRPPLHPAIPALLQGAAVLFVAQVLVRREFEAPRVAVASALTACALLTSLPWFVAFLVPDILAAAVILYAMVLVRSFDVLGGLERVALGLIAAFATASHYGHIPLAVACTGAAFLVLIVQRRFSAAVAIAGVLPLAVAAITNAVLGVVAYDGASVAPRRLPILLARSIEDGPARWHLEEHCVTEKYAVCAIFEDGVPDRVGEVLWAEGGLAGLDPETMARIREEEMRILWRAFLDYPARQLWSFVGNGAEQLVSLGTSDFQWAELQAEGGAFRVVAFDPAHCRGLLDVFGRIHAASVVMGLALLVVLLWRDGLRRGERERETLFVLAVGLFANAAIFGGLSAPADRYQARVAWILPMLALLFLLERLRQALAPEPRRSP